jgi:hypothetical protein
MTQSLRFARKQVKMGERGIRHLRRLSKAQMGYDLISISGPR